MRQLYSTGVKFFLLFVIIALQSFSIDNRQVSDFKLKDTNGKCVSLKDYGGAKGFIIVFTCNHCPFAKLYPPRLNELDKKYKHLGVPVIAISSTDTINYEEDTYPKMVAKAHNEGFLFPYLYDDAQTVAKNFGAQKTPHAFVVWIENGKYVIKYSGAIDDNGGEPAKVKNHFVAVAVDALLNGREVTVKETRSIGCQILIRK